MDDCTKREDILKITHYLNIVCTFITTRSRNVLASSAILVVETFETTLLNDLASYDWLNLRYALNLHVINSKIYWTLITIYLFFYLKTLIVSMRLSIYLKGSIVYRRAYESCPDKIILKLIKAKPEIYPDNIFLNRQFINVYVMLKVILIYALY